MKAQKMLPKEPGPVEFDPALNRNTIHSSPVIARTISIVQAPVSLTSIVVSASGGEEEFLAALGDCVGDAVGFSAKGFNLTPEIETASPIFSAHWG